MLEVVDSPSTTGEGWGTVRAPHVFLVRTYSCGPPGAPHSAGGFGKGGTLPVDTRPLRTSSMMRSSIPWLLHESAV